jgi:hypothetical protein
MVKKNPEAGIFPVSGRCKLFLRKVDQQQELRNAAGQWTGRSQDG